MDSDRQEEAGRTGGVGTGGMGTGWWLNRDGSLNAFESWQLIHVHAVSDDSASLTVSTEEVAREMMNAGADLAGQVMEQRFEEWDGPDRQARRQQFQELVQQDFTEVAAEEEISAEPQCSVVVVGNLNARVTAEVLQACFGQIGQVLDGRITGENWGWVEFELAEKAAEAVMRFDGVELAGQDMECSLWDGVQEGGGAGY
jgi:hypothetical protein